MANEPGKHNNSNTTTENNGTSTPVVFNVANNVVHNQQCTDSNKIYKYNRTGSQFLR